MPGRLPTSRLRELREQRSLKPYELAAYLHVDPSTIYRWESRGGIPDEVKFDLAEFYDVSVPYLMGWDEDVKPRRGRAAA